MSTVIHIFWGYPYSCTTDAPVPLLCLSPLTYPLLRPPPQSVGYATLALFIFMMPLYLLGNAGFPQLLALADLILIFAAIFLVFKGLFFATKLTKALGGENADESRKTLIKTITKTVYVMSISCISGTVLSVYLLFVFDRTQKAANVTLTMIFWFYFHFICEGGICYSMHIMKIMQRANKIAPLKQNKTGKSTKVESESDSGAQP